MITDLGSSKNYLTCDLTKAVLWYRPSPGEGKPDCQSLFGRLDWSEEIANPSPLGSQGDSRAKWVGKTSFLRSRHTTACVELSSAVHSKTSEVGVGDAPTGRSDLRRLNGPNELSPAMTLAGMRRFIDSDRSPAFSLLASHPCSYTGGRSVGAFSAVRRAGRLRITNGHAGNRASAIHQGSLRCRGTNFTASSTRVQARRVMSLQRPTAAFSNWNASGLDPQGVAVLTDGMSCLGRTTKDSLLGSKQGDPWVPGTSQEPVGFPGKAACRSGLRACREPDARAEHVRSTRCCGSARRGIATRPVWTAPAGHSLMGVPWQQTGTRMGSWTKAT
jgi:hypothetical protein